MYQILEKTALFLKVGGDLYASRHACITQNSESEVPFPRQVAHPISLLFMNRNG